MVSAGWISWRAFHVYRGVSGVAERLLAASVLTTARAGAAGGRAAGGRWCTSGWARQQSCVGSSSTPRRQHSSSTSSTSSNALVSNTTSYLRNLDNGAEIFLVGTAHVSKASAQEVRDMIRLVKPDAVMVELCAARGFRLRSGQSVSGNDFFKEALGSLFAPGTQMGQQLFKLSLQGFYRFLQSLGMDPGAEFKAAMEEADRIGARIVYGDRDVQQTLTRLAGSMSLQDLLRNMTGVGVPPPPQDLVDFFEGRSQHGGLEAQVEAMKTRAMARRMTEYMRQVNPQLATALVDERDAIMTDCLLRQRGRVVGVVGLAHLDGIERRWQALQHEEASAVARLGRG